jgi:hypothetical protein
MPKVIKLKPIDWLQTAPLYEVIAVLCRIDHPPKQDPEGAARQELAELERA